MNAPRLPDHLPPVSRLTRRADFVRAAKGRRCHAGPFTLQAGEADHSAVRIGFTLTKKVGNAVVRNRARRRLKEAVRLADALPVRAGHDYVLVGRIEALRVPFETLKSEVGRAVSSVHAGRPKRSQARDARPQRKQPEP